MVAGWGHKCTVCVLVMHHSTAGGSTGRYRGSSATLIRDRGEDRAVMGAAKLKMMLGWGGGWVGEAALLDERGERLCSLWYP